MFDFIKKQIAETCGPEANTATHDDSELIVECAHLFQELSDLSVEGADANRDRAISIDIPIEDDIELDSIEINLKDGRLTDVPMDATVQESNYTTMKTFNDFYQEAASSVIRFQRESEEGYESRIMARAQKNFNEYKQHVIQEGLFGFDKINLDDDRVPGSVTLDFGPMNDENPNQHYYVKLKIGWEVDRKHRILKKQLDSMNMAISMNVFDSVGGPLMESLRKKCPDAMEKVKNVWDVATPIKLEVPVDPIDKYKVYVGFECDFVDDIIWFSWTRQIKSSGSYGKMDLDIVNNNSAVENLTTMNKMAYMKESHEMRRPHRFNDFYQEAIDFGDANNNDQQPSVDTPPSPDGGSTEPTVDVASVDMGATPDVSASDDKASVPVDTNDVSDQIAEKVSENDSAKPDDLPTVDGGDMDVTFDDPMADPSIDGDVPAPDMGSGDVDPTSVDQKLTGLDDAGTMDSELGDSTNSGIGNVDVENMTIDELLAQGSEKLKGMTIQQLKDFLGSESIPTDDGIGEEPVQEAFFLTSKNIKSEIDIHLRKSLGILNDNEMALSELIQAFKAEGKKLNRVLSKASKMKNVFSDDDRDNITKLNKCLVDLMMALKKSQSESDVAVVKRLIRAFTSQSVVVAKIIEVESNDNSEQKGGE